MANALECPICLEEPSPPIYQCTNGHIVCSTCELQILICGICRERMPKKRTRCLMAEQLMETIVKLRMSKSRERLMNYCSLLGLNNILLCKENVRRDQIVGHVKQHHLSGVNGSKADVIQELKDFESPQSWFPVYFEAYDETFFLLSGIRKDSDHDSSLVVSWKCAIIGDDLAAEKYCVQLRLTSNDKNLKYLFNCSVFGIENGDHRRNDTHVLLPLSQLKQFGKYNWINKLEWTINVQIGKKSENENGFLKMYNTEVPTAKTFPYILASEERPSCSVNCLMVQTVQTVGNGKVFMDLEYEKKLIGRLIIELRYDVVPLTAENFRCLCTGEKGISYKGGRFFFISPQNYMTGGCVTRNDGNGDENISTVSRDAIMKEKCSLKHYDRGVLSMYNRGTNNINCSVFTIILQQKPCWDGKYAVFGKVVEGMKVLDDLENLLSLSYGLNAMDEKTVIQNCGEI